MGLFDDIQDVARHVAYFGVLNNLLLFKPKPGGGFRSRAGTAVDEIILHGTESLGTEEQSATSLTGGSRSIHYFIGRTHGVAYSIIPEDQQAFHAGNPDGVAGVQDHNPRSIGIEMYQRDISTFGGNAAMLDFTDWQYETVAMLIYDIRRRRGITSANVKGHVDVNSVQRGDPRNFDWPRCRRRVSDLSRTLGGLLGEDFRVDLDIPFPFLLMR